MGSQGTKQTGRNIMEENVKNPTSQWKEEK